MDRHLGGPGIRVENVGDGVRLIVLDAPERHNAIDLPMMAALTGAIEAAGSDADVRAVILTGSGPSFCAGAALHALPEALDIEPAARPAAILALRSMAKPSFAAVRGAAYGLGMGLALACDFRIVSATAKFNSAFIRHGLVPGDGSTWTLPRLVGRSRALWIHQFAETTNAEDAFRLGLADELVADTGLIPTAVRRAAALATSPALPIELVKHLVDSGAHDDFTDHIERAARAQVLARSVSEATTDASSE